MSEVELMVKRFSVKEGLKLVSERGMYLEHMDEFKDYYITRDFEKDEYVLIHKEKFNKFLFDNRRRLNEIFELIMVGYFYKKYMGKHFDYNSVPDFSYIIDNIIGEYELSKINLKNDNGVIIDYISKMKLIMLFQKYKIIIISGIYFSKIRNLFDLEPIEAFYFDKAYKDNLYYIYSPSQMYRKYKVYLIIDNTILKENILDYVHPSLILYIYKKFFE